MIKIKLPQLSWESTELENIYKLLQATPELGFLYKASIRDHVRANSERGTLWAAYMDEKLVGVTTISSRRPYSHLIRHGETVVLPEARRQRVGTSFYYTQVLQSLLEGRRQVEVTIISGLSPFMVRPTGCTGIGFLPSLGYVLYGTLPNRTRGFKDIQIWGATTYELILDTYSSRVPIDTTIEFLDTPKMRATFEKNMRTYEKHDPALVGILSKYRQWVLDEFDVEILQDETGE